LAPDFDNRRAVPTHPDHFSAWRIRSEAMSRQPAARLALRYAPNERAALDWFPARTCARPIVAFVHGGYWQWNSRQEFAFVAEGLQSLDLNVAVLGYPLAPAARLPTIVAHIRQACDWLIANAVGLGASPQLYLSGWSAGAHLCAAVLDDPRLSGAVCISGIYELAPLRGTAIDQALDLSDQDIETLSPALARLSHSCPLLLACGQLELPELERQTRYYDEVRGIAHLPTKLSMVAACNHYSVLETFAHPDGMLLAEAAALFGWH
jgi:acetyl esterase/lipase